ncbi:ImpA family type VI secretion system protein [Sagittula sp. S175]|uniref:type VI secretion system protein TssA n=1 Tax=Sagittula sp. S175 TaxID=3415129 RepID=UPI003C7EB36C
MDLEKLLTPISEEAPCGPDLEPEGDPDYDEAYFDRMGELPEWYFRPGVEKPDGSMTPDQFFDPKSVNFREECGLIDPILERTRDLRLVVLRAQWAILSGNLPKFIECIDWVAGLLETFDADVHPTDSSDRRSAVNDLNDVNTVMYPLMFAGLTPTGDASLRKLKVARGELSPLQSEQELEQAPILDSLSSASNAKAVEKMLEQLLKLREALNRIKAACEKSAVAKFSPDFSRFAPTVNEMIDAITNARSDLLSAATAAEEPASGEAGEDDGGATSGGAVFSAAAAAAQGGGTSVVSHLHAKRMLEACESYYRLYEPSSATLLMVTQARSLIGKPLLEALETLLPDHVEEAQVKFSPATGFLLGIARIRELTNDYGDDPADPLPEPDPGPEVRITSPAEAAVAIRAVEDYFRKVERSSPIPTLLSRARSYLDRDFQSIIEELIPKEED